MNHTQNTRLNSINTLITVVEEDYNKGYSILSYDEEGGIWVESFADTIDKAQEKAVKQHEKIIKEY